MYGYAWTEMEDSSSAAVVPADVAIQMNELVAVQAQAEAAAAQQGSNTAADSAHLAVPGTEKSAAEKRKVCS